MIPEVNLLLNNLKLFDQIIPVLNYYTNTIKSQPQTYNKRLVAKLLYNSHCPSDRSNENYDCLANASQISHHPRYFKISDFF